MRLEERKIGGILEARHLVERSMLLFERTLKVLLGLLESTLRVDIDLELRLLEDATTVPSVPAITIS